MALPEDFLRDVFRLVSRKSGSFTHLLVCQEWHRIACDDLSHADVTLGVRDNPPETNREGGIDFLAKARRPSRVLVGPFVLTRFFRRLFGGMPDGNRVPRMDCNHASTRVSNDEGSDLLRMVRELSSFSCLTSLSVNIRINCNVWVDGIPDPVSRLCEVITCLPKLRKLQVSGLQCIEPATLRCFDLAAILRGAPWLQELGFTETGQHPARGPRRRRFDADSCRRVTLDELPLGLCSLKRLSLGQFFLRSLSPEVSRLTSLTSLSANIHTRVSLAGRILLGLPKLRHVAIHSADSTLRVTPGRLLLRIVPDVYSPTLSQRFAEIVIESITKLGDTAQWKGGITRASLFLEEIDRLPDNFFSDFSALNSLRIHSSSLLSLPPSIGSCIEHLHSLELHTPVLSQLPGCFLSSRGLRSLSLNLNSCSYLFLPGFLELQDRLQVLKIEGMDGLREICSSAEHWTGLKELSLTHCDSLTRLPAGFHGLRSVRRLRVKGCPSLSLLQGDFAVPYFSQEVPDAGNAVFNQAPTSSFRPQVPALNFLGSLEELDVEGPFLDATFARSLPHFLQVMRRLKVLRLQDLPELTSIPESILDHLQQLVVLQCGKLLTTFPFRLERFAEWLASEECVRMEWGRESCPREVWETVSYQRKNKRRIVFKLILQN